MKEEQLSAEESLTSSTADIRSQLLAATAAIVWIIPGFMLRIHFRKTSV